MYIDGYGDNSDSISTSLLQIIGRILFMLFEPTILKLALIALFKGYFS